jgi:hypothetical protein
MQNVFLSDFCPFIFSELLKAVQVEDDGSHVEMAVP